MSPFNRLIELFRRFPGIGPRQAERFAYFLMSQDGRFSQELAREIERLHQESNQCSSCFRHFVGAKGLCSICAQSNRDHSKRLVVVYNADLENIERTGLFDGLYFVLGGIVPILEEAPEKRVRIIELERIVQETKDLKEIILAMSATTEGEHTAEFIQNRLKKLIEPRSIRLSMLGRGLSTGTELEYVDSDTLASALKNRA